MTYQTLNEIFKKIYHQQEQNSTIWIKKLISISEKNNNHLQIRNAHLQFDLIMRKIALPHHPGDPPNPFDTDFFDAEAIRLVNNAFAFTKNGRYWF